jgi:hypothetical protein
MVVECCHYVHARSLWKRSDKKRNIFHDFDVRSTEAMMKGNILFTRIIVVCLVWTSLQAQPKSVSSISKLEKRDKATQLIVDNKPFLVLAGELTNTAASSPEHMKKVWPHLVKVGLNTVLTPIAWAWIEPKEGKFDFTFADNVIRDAKINNMRIVWLWFASWKNGLTNFAPAWVMSNQVRFPRAQLAGGKTVEVLSTLSDANRDADAKAFATFMRHIKELDSAAGTTIMVQLENEVGLLGDSRDRSVLANEAFARPVPRELTGYLKAHKDSLLPETRKAWEEAGSKISGTWEQVFGAGPGRADEIFMAWHYSRYIGKVAEAGKAEYPVPMFVNAWLVQPEDRGPGDYPSGGPQDHMHDIWRTGGPQIDMLSPDIYLPNFTEQAARYIRRGGPLFIPESSGTAAGAANAFYAIGQLNAIGYSPMRIDQPMRMVDFRPGTGVASTMPIDVESQPFAKAYNVLAQLSPLILEHQARGTIGAAWLNKGLQMMDIVLGGYTVNVNLRRNRRAPDIIPEVGYAIVIASGQDEFTVAGNDVQVTFLPRTPGPPVAGLARVEAGRFENGRWVVTRLLAGDDCVLEYVQAKAAAAKQSGSGLRFMDDGPTIQRVMLYRYQ